MGIRPTLVHVTHEAANKMGGIGAVLEGFFTCQSYLDTVERSILVGPLFTTEGSVLDRLGDNGEVLYSSIDGLLKTGYASAFSKIESFFNVGIIYGRRTFVDSQTGIKSSPEVVLIDVRNADPGPVNEFKARLFEEFDIKSDLYENLWDFEQYVRLSLPTLAILKAIGAATSKTVVVAHEYMGMPAAMAAMLDETCDYKTVFYAHEVATMRKIVEDHPGHDTMFYNVIKKAHQQKLYVEDIFGPQDKYYKHPLVDASKRCDAIFAVGGLVADEMRFLGPEFEKARINVVYNGIHAYKTTVEEKLASKHKLQQYCLNLLGYYPDYVFTHVTRLVRSKGLWRDLRVLEHLDNAFTRAGKTAVMYMLTTEVCQRRSCDVFEMEARYDWPVAHREGWPDLSGGEAMFYTAIQEFNARSKSVKVIFINQFGFSRKLCGNKMPADMEVIDIHRGTDVEFGQSIYEPFGISPVEPLTFGGICVFSDVSGCAGFVGDAVVGTNSSDKDGVRNFIVADYTGLNGKYHEIKDLLNIDRAVRDQVEEKESQEIADEILMILPRSESEIASLVENGRRIATNMSWDVVVTEYLLPTFEKIIHTPKMAQLQKAAKTSKM
jgi:hypothetical protein